MSYFAIIADAGCDLSEVYFFNSLTLNNSGNSC